MTSTNTPEIATPPRAQNQRVPTFLFIGGQRCGSSWVHKCLDEHPQVFTATPKEVHFFNRNYQQGRAWYLDHFSQAAGDQAVGEVTPDYIADPDCPARAYEINPDLRLIAVLREPIERAHSLYRLKMGTTMQYPTFSEAVEHHPDMIEHGHYAEHLKRWCQYFNRDQLLVLLYEDLVESDRDTIRAIYAHIGVDPDFVPSWIGRTDNAAVFPRLRARLRKLGLEPLVKLIGRSKLGDRIRARTHAKKRDSSGGPDIDAQMAEQLAAHYQPHNDRLRSMLGRDLKGWS